MNTVLIIPPLVSRLNSISSGIFFMPFTMAHLAGALREAGFGVGVIDMFALAPHRSAIVGSNIHLGISTDDMVQRLPSDSEIVFIYAWGVASFKAIEEMIRAIDRDRPEVPIVVVENANAVTSMSLSHVAGELLEMGADYVLLGEAEHRALELIDFIQGKGDLPVDGIAYRSAGVDVVRPAASYIEDLDQLPMPAWDLFPVESYWRLGYAHGPQEGKYLALLTSRGCPFGCKFCVLPSTSNRRWRARSPESVFDEMLHWYDTMGVREFHLEDVNPTTNKERLAKLGDLVAASGLPFIWKFVSGTKIETISVESLERMARGGCRYVSFSPESGSKRVMKLIGKPFDHEHALDLTARMRGLGVHSQAVFLLGFPGEEEEDREMSLQYLSKLVKAGVDEVLILITTPIPGSAIFDQFSGFEDYSELTFTPTYRSDYAELLAWQRRMYIRFFLLKAVYQPGRCVGHVLNLVRRRFKTKMEMTAWRYWIVKKDSLLAPRQG